jgi:hypothetical protein
MLSEIESKVIDILVGFGVARDAWMEPIYAVDRAMGWGTDETTKFVHDLMHRKLIRVVPIVREGQVFDPKARWEKVT